MEIVDRDRALAQVMEWAERGTRFPVVIFGPEGCGKTAFLRQAASGLRELGYDVFYLQPRNQIEGAKPTLLYIGGTTKYLKRGVCLLMPTKLKGMTSVEIAIIAGIVLVIAVAVGWYLYTTYAASITAQPKIHIISAVGYQINNSLRIVVFNPGPVNVRITQVEVATAPISLINPIDVPIGQQRVVSVSVPTAVATLTAGTTITGRVILASGHSFPFTAAVRP
jgi:type IV pilus assembly protein PilA